LFLLKKNENLLAAIEKRTKTETPQDRVMKVVVHASAPSSPRSFTLIELLVTITVIAILAALLVSRFLFRNCRLQKTRNATRPALEGTKPPPG